MSSPSADSKFVLSVLKSLGILKFLKYTQNVLGILKWDNLCSKILLLSISKLFWVCLKNWACVKDLSTLKTNFESADGLGTSYREYILIKNLQYILSFQWPISNTF